MPRRLTPQDQDFAMERLNANRGDVALTARELGISKPTLYRLKKLRIDSQFSLSSLSSNVSQPASTTADSKSLSVHGEGFREGLPTNDLNALLNLKAKMLELADYIVANDEIKRAIDAAPLHQRIAALVQLTDRILKLGIELPPQPDDEFVAYEKEETDGEEDTFDAETIPQADENSGL